MFYLENVQYLEYLIICVSLSISPAVLFKVCIVMHKDWNTELDIYVH